MSSVDDEEDMMESFEEDFSQPELSDFENWSQGDGKERLKEEIETIKRFGYDAGCASPCLPPLHRHASFLDCLR